MDFSRANPGVKKNLHIFAQKVLAHALERIILSSQMATKSLTLRPVPRVVLLLTKEEYKALQKQAAHSKRKITDQLRWYIAEKEKPQLQTV